MIGVSNYNDVAMLLFGYAAILFAGLSGLALIIWALSRLSKFNADQIKALDE